MSRRDIFRGILSLGNIDPGILYRGILCGDTVQGILCGDIVQGDVVLESFCPSLSIKKTRILTCARVIETCIGLRFVYALREPINHTLE